MRWHAGRNKKKCDFEAVLLLRPRSRVQTTVGCRAPSEKPPSTVPKMLCRLMSGGDPRITSSSAQEQTERVFRDMFIHVVMSGLTFCQLLVSE